MYLAESHIHSHYSPDSHFTMEEMADAAAAKGANYICFTDHFDDCAVNDALSFFVTPFGEWEERREEFERVRDKYAGKMEICLGGEVGSVNHMPDVARSIYEDRGLDFVIGSLHSLRDTDDFYRIKYTSLDQCIDLTERYFREYVELAETGHCDILGHLGYTKRYMIRQGFTFDTMIFEDLIREVFSVIIPKGIGIELNTSGLRDELQESIPTPEVFAIYREMGGEIVTVGSDSHTVDTACAGIREGYEILKNAGFEYVTVFRQHEPFFEKI